MKNSPLVSIVVATRNRQRYAMPSVRALCDSFQSDDVEFVFQDSSDDQSLRVYIESEIRDPRVQYRYSPPPLNMTQNYNLAVSHAKGRYVCMIGDDDGVNPEIMDAAQWAEVNNVDALTPVSATTYYWPDFRSRYYRGVHAGKMYLRAFSGSLSKVDGQKAVTRCVRGAAFGIEQWDLPKIYLALIRRDRLEEIRLRTGHYFAGISPDIYGAIAAAHLCHNAYIIDYPLIMGGSGGASNAGLSAQRRHKGTFEEAVHMRNYSAADWPDGVPRYWTTETAYSNSALLALHDLGRQDLIQNFNFPLLHAICLISHPDYYAETIRSYRRAMAITNVNPWVGWSQFVSYSALEVLRRAVRLGQRLLSPGPAQGAKVCPHLNDIGAAITSLTSSLREDSIRLRNYTRDTTNTLAGTTRRAAK